MLGVLGQLHVQLCCRAEAWQVLPRPHACVRSFEYVAPCCSHVGRAVRSAHGLLHCMWSPCSGPLQGFDEKARRLHCELHEDAKAWIGREPCQQGPAAGQAAGRQGGNYASTYCSPTLSSHTRPHTTKSSRALLSRLVVPVSAGASTIPWLVCRTWSWRNAL